MGLDIQTRVFDLINIKCWIHVTLNRPKYLDMKNIVFLFIDWWIIFFLHTLNDTGKSQELANVIFVYFRLAYFRYLPFCIPTFLYLSFKNHVGIFLHITKRNFAKSYFDRCILTLIRKYECKILDAKLLNSSKIINFAAAVFIKE